jgi:GT2 family glycosyltransferase
VVRFPDAAGILRRLQGQQVMKLGFVCTNYNNSAFTRTAVASLHGGGRRDDVRVVVVDNRSRADDVEALGTLPGEFPGVEILLNPENVGYFPGLNIGIRHLRARFPEVEHLVVGNNDLVFPPGFVDAVERHRGALDTWAAVAPDLVTPDGVHQNPHVLHPIGRLRRLAWDVYFLNYGTGLLVKYAARAARRFTVREENDPASQLYRTGGPIEQGYGACYLLGPAFFRRFEKLCAPTFLMQEEFFLGEQLKLIGQRTFYEPGLVVLHHGHATTDRLPGRRQWAIGREAHRVYKRYLRLGPEERRRMVSEGSGRPA